MSYLGQNIKRRIVPIEKSAEDDALAALLKKLEPDLAAKILAAFEAQQGAISLAAIVAALERGDISAVLAMLEIPQAVSAMRGVAAATHDAVWAAAMAQAAGINRLFRGVSFTFNRLSPTLVPALQQYEMKLIREIDAGTREGIREFLIGGMEAGRNPRDTARDVRSIIGLTARQAKAVKNFRKELESFHLRTSAKGYNLGGKIDRAPGGAQVFKPDEDGAPKDGILDRRLRDFRFDGQMRRSMESGKPLSKAQIDRMVDAYARKYLKYRSENIARTESMRSLNFGVQESWRQAIQTGVVKESAVRRKWSLSPDERLCADCAPIPEMNKAGVTFGMPFATPIGPLMLPPVHPSCRCRVLIRTV